MKRLAVWGACLAIAPAAFGGFIAGPFTGNSNGPVGDAGNTTNSYLYAGPEFFAGNIRLEGDLTEVNTGTYASEARIRVGNPGGGFWNSGAWTTTTSFTGTIHIGPSTQLSSGLTGTANGTWTFECYESYNDTGLDATWANLNIEVQDGVTPPPAFPGNFTGTPNVLAWNVPAAGTTIWGGPPGQSGLTDGAGELALSTRYTGTTLDELGNEVGYRIDHLGGDLFVDLTGLATDLDLFLIDATGLPVNTLDTSTGVSSEHVELLGAPAGTYYAAVDTYGSTNQGSAYSILYTPEPSTLAVLALSALGLLRRR